MRIIMNPDADFVAKMRRSVLDREGYCPCRIEKKEVNYCMCQEFRDQIADPQFEGFCHCRLYYKEK